MESNIDEVNFRWYQEQTLRNKFVYDLTGEEKAEFINGEIITQSPAKARHIVITEKLIRLLGLFLDYHPIGLIFFEKALIRMTRNDYEPDLVFYLNESAREIIPQTEVFPIPDFIVEILSPSTEFRDRGVKFRDYALHHVSEYWIIDPINEQIEQYILTPDLNYHLKGIFPNYENSIIQCEVINGLEFPIKAIFDNEALKNWTVQFLKQKL